MFYYRGEHQGRSRQLWRKVLYEDQGVPDNYVDSSFLREMQKNLFVRSYNYWSVVLSTGCITQQINTVIIFVMCFIYLQEKLLTSYLLNTISAVLLLVGYAFTVMTNCSACDIKALIIFCTAAFVLSPVLMSLTETISTDTIYAMTAIMLLAHLISYDYELHASTDGVISFNAGIFATVCLASRLPNLLLGYSLIILSAFVFGMLPNMRRELRSHFFPYLDIIMTVVHFVCALALVCSKSFTVAILLFCGFFFIMFICPHLLLRLQPLKNNLHGPWDEAVVVES